MLPGKIMAFDPGKTTGFAIFEPTGKLDTFGQLSMEQMEQFCNEYKEPVAVVIAEDYVLFKRRALQQSGSRMHASQVIGMLRVFARKMDAKFILQDAERKLDGERLSQKHPPSDHDYSHQVDAYNHAFFWMHRAGIVRSKLEEERLG